MADLSTTYMGLKLKNPIIAGSSGLTDNVKNIRELQENGAAAVVLKSLFEEEIRLDLENKMSQMGSETYLYPETLEYYEDYDPREEELTTKYLNLVREVKSAVDIPVIASINCVTSDQWTYFPRMLEEAGADGLELNVFILPSDLNRSAEENEKVYFDIISEVKKQVSIPIALKMSYYFSNLANVIQRFSETGIDSLVLFNRFYSPDFDLDNMEVVATNVLSSPGDLPISLRWVGIMAERVSCDISASTGVHEGSAVIKQLLAGASTVQVVSTLYRNGIPIMQGLLKELEGWMDKNRYASIDDFRGRMSQSKAKDPAAYERVQFMKYFRGYEYMQSR